MDIETTSYLAPLVEFLADIPHVRSAGEAEPTRAVNLTAPAWPGESEVDDALLAAITDAANTSAVQAILDIYGNGAGDTVLPGADCPAEILCYIPEPPVDPLPADGLNGGGNQADPHNPPCQAADPVICPTGNFYETYSDIGLSGGRGPAVEFIRTYNSRRAGEASDALGYGWTSNYGAHLEFGSDTVTLVQGNGSVAGFHAKPDGTFRAAEWHLATMSESGGDLIVGYPDGTEQVFDSDTGKLLKIRDRNGYEVVLTYDSGRLAAATDANGRALMFSYDAGGRIAQVADAGGRAVAYAYNASGELTTVTDLGGEETSYEYDSAHRMTKVTNPRGAATTNEYDASGRVITQTDPEDGTWAWSYDPNRTTVTSPRGSKTIITHIGYLPVKIVRAAGTADAATEIRRYDATGNIVERVAAGGRRVTFSYDARGNLTRTEDPLGRETAMTYNSFNEPLTVEDPSGVTTTFTYDSRGNLRTTSRPLTGTSQVQSTTYTYDSDHPGELVSMTDPRGKTWSYDHDAQGNVSAVTDPDGYKTTITYDSLGRPSSSVSPAGNAVGRDPDLYRTRFEYNAFGDLTKETDPLGNATELGYDAARNRITVKNARGHLTRTTYDLLNRPTTVTRPDGSTVKTRYDGDGNANQVTTGRGHKTTYEFDMLERVVKTTDPLNRSETLGYSPAGDLSARTDRIGRTTDFEHDAAGQLLAIRYHDPGADGTPDVEFTYDSLGRRSTMKDGTGTSTFHYDSLGRLKDETDGGGWTLSYDYDLAGNLTSETYPGSKMVTRAYTDAGRPSSVTDWLAKRTRFTYDPGGLRAAMIHPNGTRAEYTHDHAGQLTRISHKGANGLVFLDLPYIRDANGAVTQTKTTAGVEATFAYDELERLISATTATGGPGTGTWEYDDSDAAVAMPGALGTETTLVYDDAGQLVSRADASGTNIASYRYNANGERTHDDDLTSTGLLRVYGWDRAGRLRTYAGGPASPRVPGTPADVHAAYSYDGDGLLAALQWSHAGGRLPAPVAEGEYLYVNGPDGLPLEQVGPNGTVRFYHQDAIGSTRALTGSFATVTATYDYDPYGRQLATSTVANPFGFAGQYTDEKTGHVYMRARWYDPATGQFLSRDPLGFAAGDQQLYGYAGRQPLDRVDPSGLCSLRFWTGSFWSVDNCFHGGVLQLTNAIGYSAEDISLATGLFAQLTTGLIGTPLAPLPIALGGISAATGALAAGDAAGRGDELGASIDLLTAAVGGTASAMRVLQIAAEWAQRWRLSEPASASYERWAARDLAEMLEAGGYPSLAWAIFRKLQCI